jgi:hypothetical protein
MMADPSDENKKAYFVANTRLRVFYGEGPQAAAKFLGQRGGAKGGKSTSEAKQRAARRNGKCGGCPKVPRRAVLP